MIVLRSGKLCRDIIKNSLKALTETVAEAIQLKSEGLWAPTALHTQGLGRNNPEIIKVI